MKLRACLALGVLTVFISCEDNDECVSLCEKLDRCGFLPSAMGADRDNCAARCRTSQEVAERVRSCIREQPPYWHDLSAGAPADPAREAERELVGCPSYAECLSHIDGDGSLRGRGRVMVIPTEEIWSGTEQKRDRECRAAVSRRDAEEICAAWGVARATTVLFDGKRRLRGTFSTCAAALTHQPVFDDVVVGRLRASLILEGKIEMARPNESQQGGQGGAPAWSATNGESGASGADGGAATERITVPEPCFVIPAPIQVNDAGPACVGIALPFARDLEEAYVCERDSACSDNLDNDHDGWVDCDDPKCQQYCAELTSAAAGGASPIQP